MFRNQLEKELENWRSQQLRIAASNQQPRIATSNICMQPTTMEEAYSSRTDLKDVPDWEVYADESSFVQDGKHATGVLA
ncbi:hypothetical protein DUI87_01321 [Hirundo rustica rustica]|uniref:Uncharacterized protein n=1 Tax=Hirundo rustica rustica TaxID=333673 RepID=A0A3M0L5W3_HIRRU|nr:hypothetical protein DUI87_01321 [Hirundo rustica rustica]